MVMNSLWKLTSFASTLLDPFWVCYVIVTSFTVEKCPDGKDDFTQTIHTIKELIWYESISGYVENSTTQIWRTPHLFTSLASLAMKKPSVPSCIFTWLPGLIRVLWKTNHRMSSENCPPNHTRSWQHFCTHDGTAHATTSIHIQKWTIKHSHTDQNWRK